MNRLTALFILLLLVSTAVLASYSFAERADPNAVRNEIRDILSNSEYNRDYSKPDFMEKLLKPFDKLIERFIEWLNGLFGVENKEANRVISFTLACVVIAAFLILVALVIRKLAGRKQAPDNDDQLDIADYDLPSSRPLIKEAVRLAELGDYRSAYRCAYLASISYLDEAKALRFERSRTNWEYLRELRQGGFEKRYNQLQPLTLEFDRKFYGRENCTRDDYINAVRTYEQIISEDAA